MPQQALEMLEAPERTDPGDRAGRRRASSQTARLIATVLGLGDRLPAPGTFAGSLPAAAVSWLLLEMVEPRPARIMSLLVMVSACAAIGCWASQREAERRGAGDPGPVVIDEVAGQWLTYLIVTPWLAAYEPGLLIAPIIGGFLLFRVFDILKPWPVNRLERLPGGLGIMADDLAAGCYAGLTLAALTPLLAPWLAEVL